MATTVLGLKNDYADQSTIAASDLNTVANSLESVVAGYGAVDVSGGVTVTLLAAQYGLSVIELTGLLTANINVLFPAQARRWIVVNSTSGAFTVTCKTAAGTGVVVTQGRVAHLRSDGVNISRVGLDISDAGAATGGGDLDFAGGYRCVIDGWYYDNLAISITNGLMSRFPAAGMPSSWVAVRAGSVTGLVLKSNAARTNGTATATVFKNGVATALTALLDGTNTTVKASTSAKDAIPFAAGDELDVRITSSGTWAPTTADLRASIEVET